MHIAYNGMTALRILRSLRAVGMLPTGRCDLAEPNCEPRRRWTRSLVDLGRFGLELADGGVVDVAVPRKDKRIQASFVRNTVYSNERSGWRGLPDGAFIDLGEGVAIASPELLFCELAATMEPAPHAMLGYELCGTFGRNAQDPRCGEVAYGIEPATTVERLRAFAEQMPRGRGSTKALRTLRHVEDNAWSPMEAVLATMLELPPDQYGYGLGRTELNRRYDAPEELIAAGCRASRVPDVELRAYGVGFNYDGHVHLELEGVRDALDAADVEATAAALAAVREKYVDDLRRNRELAAHGLVIMPVTSEDLYAQGGLDLLVREALMAARELRGRSVKKALAVLDSPVIAQRRQQLVWSLLPWEAAAGYGARLAAIERDAFAHAHLEEFDLQV